VARTEAEIAAIGGNVDQSVEKKHCKLDAGFLTAVNEDKGFAMLINQMGGAQAASLGAAIGPEAAGHPAEFAPEQWLGTDRVLYSGGEG
jgi:hypothetical protein